MKLKDEILADWEEHHDSFEYVAQRVGSSATHVRDVMSKHRPTAIEFVRVRAKYNLQPHPLMTLWEDDDAA